MKYRIVEFIARLLGVRILIQQGAVSDLPMLDWQTDPNNALALSAISWAIPATFK